MPGVVETAEVESACPVSTDGEPWLSFGQATPGGNASPTWPHLPAFQETRVFLFEV